MDGYRYSHWDGSQDLSWLDADALLKELSDDILEHGDIDHAIRRVMQRGLQGPMGSRLKGLQELIQQLRDRRQQALNKYDLSSVMDDIKKKLEDVVQTERAGIQRRLDETDELIQSPDGAADQQSAQGDSAKQEPSDEQTFRKMLERLAEKKLSFLDRLPDNPAGAIKELSNYEFLDPDARRKFDELLNTLQQKVMDSYFQSLSQNLQSLTPEDMSRLRQMLSDLNEMLEQKKRGEEPDFHDFMQKYGDFFPDQPQSLDELMENLQRRRAQMQSLLDSMPADQRKALQEMARALVQDPAMQQQLAELDGNLEQLFPSRHLRNRYPFRGGGPLSLTESMELMERLQQMDELERQLRRADDLSGLEQIDGEKLGDLLGEEARQSFEELRRLLEKLKEAGYLEQKGNRLELTAKGMRRIGQKALDDIFSRIKKDRFGKHETRFRGASGEQDVETKRYEFGDAFHLNLERTLMNAVFRGESDPPIRLRPDDFEVYQTRLFSHSSTVVMLDMSWSMAMRGNFLAAKKVALALDNLIRTKFPKDTIYLIGFSRYAAQMTSEELIRSTVDEFAYGTNIHQALMLARKLLGRNTGGNRQIIMISDGEPTAHTEGGQSFFSYPPTPRTVQLTLREVRRCTQQGITINTFMLENDHSLVDFVNQLTRLNRGRAFFATSDSLGEYILVDYLSSKKRRIS
ncbi:MAG: VWA domain-containing protein [Chloroflexota bacterium]|nr:MAG: VWA domain-containing protein [Chloroflexota bacterium]